MTGTAVCLFICLPLPIDILIHRTSAYVQKTCSKREIGRASGRAASLRVRRVREAASLPWPSPWLALLRSPSISPMGTLHATTCVCAPRPHGARTHPKQNRRHRTFTTHSTVPCSNGKPETAAGPAATLCDKIEAGAWQSQNAVPMALGTVSGSMGRPVDRANPLPACFAGRPRAQRILSGFAAHGCVVRMISISEGSPRICRSACQG